MSKLFFLSSCFVLFLFLARFSYSSDHESMMRSEFCTISDNYVLLYKIINWWNDSLPEDDNLLCGDVLRCRSGGGMKVRYDAATQELLLTSDDNLEELISIFKPCKTCFGPKYLQCFWLNGKVFNQRTVLPQPTVSHAINRFHFRNIHPRTAKWFEEEAQNIIVQVEGRIGGLLFEDGRIALHSKGTFLKGCPVAERKGAADTIRVVLLNGETGEELAKYQIVEGK